MEEHEAPQQELPNFRDLQQIYLGARASILTVESFYDLFFKVLFLVDIGKEMLPNDAEGFNLRLEADEILKNPKTYPQNSQMEYTSGNYRISTGGHDTGLIEVIQGDIGFGLQEAREQKATTLLPKLKTIDSKIFRKLVEFGIIEISRPTMEDMMNDELRVAIQNEISKKEEEEENDEL
jgi:hypothetical protein